MAEIAARDNVTDNYVSNLIHLAWLPPHKSLIWRAIRQPPAAKIQCSPATLMSYGESRRDARGRR
jgi:hypothetical protein